MGNLKIKEIIKEEYGKIAKDESSCGCGCCIGDTDEFAKSIGYTDEELAVIPEGANMALSCGNPTALAGLREGEVVVDLGSGGGFDCFLATHKVGTTGRVIGIDMTPEMINKAKANASKNGINNVDFRLGEIESLPVESGTADVVISNCVINLSADKHKVFSEIYRVLKPGGRVAISDITLTKELPEKVRQSIAAYTGCVAGAVLTKEYEQLVKDAGFKDVRVTATNQSLSENPHVKDPVAKSIIEGLEKEETIWDYVESVYVEAYK